MMLMNSGPSPLGYKQWVGAKGGAAKDGYLAPYELVLILISNAPEIPLLSALCY
jgi:hypothetical protein